MAVEPILPLAGSSGMPSTGLTGAEQPRAHCSTRSVRRTSSYSVSKRSSPSAPWTLPAFGTIPPLRVLWLGLPLGLTRIVRQEASHPDLVVVPRLPGGSTKPRRGARSCARPEGERLRSHGHAPNRSPRSSDDFMNRSSRHRETRFAARAANCRILLGIGSLRYVAAATDSHRTVLWLVEVLDDTLVRHSCLVPIPHRPVDRKRGRRDERGRMAHGLP